MDFNRMRTNNYHSPLPNNSVQPFFDRLEERLVNYIENSSYVVGCVAWLTNRNIIDALKDVKGVKIIINKEEYLSSKMQIGQKFFYKCLRGKYHDMSDMFGTHSCGCCSKNMLQCANFNKVFNTVLMNREGGILTCGIVNNFSKMHHKFLIFFNDKIEPTGVWTGSYNLSKNSNMSLENALYITDKEVIMEYIREFMVIYPYSESCNWKSGVLAAPINS